MKELEEFLDKQKGVVKTYLIPSKSVPGDMHRVDVLKSGEIICECIRSMFRKKCSHIKIVEDKLKEEKV